MMAFSQLWFPLARLQLVSNWQQTNLRLLARPACELLQSLREQIIPKDSEHTTQVGHHTWTFLGLEVCNTVLVWWGNREKRAWSLLGCHNKILWSRWLKQWAFVFLMIWRLESRNQGTNMVCSWWVLSPWLANGHLFPMCLPGLSLVCVIHKRQRRGISSLLPLFCRTTSPIELDLTFISSYILYCLKALSPNHAGSQIFNMPMLKGRSSVGSTMQVLIINIYCLVSFLWA